MERSQSQGKRFFKMRDFACFCVEKNESEKSQSRHLLGLQAQRAALFFWENPLLPLCKMSALDRGRPSPLTGALDLANQNIPSPGHSDCFRDGHMAEHLPTRLSSRLQEVLGKGSSLSAGIAKIMGRRSGATMCPRKTLENKEINREESNLKGYREMDCF